MARRPILIAALCSIVAVMGYVLWPRDAARIETLLNDTIGKINQTRDAATLAELDEHLRGALLPSATVRITELDVDLSGIEAVTARTPELLAGPPLKLGWIGLDPRVSGSLATVDAELIVAVRGGAEQRPQPRRTRVRLTKRDDQWRIESLEVDPVSPSEPEARP
jgi:hypothetical protein